MYDIYDKNKTLYDSVSQTIAVKGNDYVKNIEYYDHGRTHKKVRSISFTLHDMKDSIWTTYAEDGKIIKQEIYKAGALIKTIK